MSRPHKSVPGDHVAVAEIDHSSSAGPPETTVSGAFGPPSYTKHQHPADLADRIAVVAMNEIADAMRDAIHGRSSREAIVAGGHAMCRWVLEHPGQYAAGNTARVTGPRDPLIRLSSGCSPLGRPCSAATKWIQTRRAMHCRRSAASSADSPPWKPRAVSRWTPMSNSFTWMLNAIDRGLISPIHRPLTSSVTIHSATEVQELGLLHE